MLNSQPNVRVLGRIGARELKPEEAEMVSGSCNLNLITNRPTYINGKPLDEHIDPCV